MRRKSFRLFFTASLLILDLAGLTISFEGAYRTRFIWPLFLAHFPATKGIPDISLYHQALWALLPMYGFLFYYAGFYKETVLGAYDEFVQVVRGVFLCSLLTMAMTFAYRGAEYSRLTIGLWAAYSIVVIYLLRELDKALFSHLFFRIAGPQQVLIIGKGKALDAIREMTSKQPFVRIHYQESLPKNEALHHFLQTKRISEILLLQGPLSSQEILEAAQICENLNVTCKIIPDLLEMRRGEIIVDGFCGLPTFTIKSLSLYGLNYVLKRSFDIAVSSVILILFFIPLTIIGILIHFDSHGPVLFTQNRMGFLGRNFKLYKFRTMIADADLHIEKLKHLSDRSGPVFKMKNDPRITPLGKWLRKFSLDELPQILNVLKGDMSLVGPRPQVLWEGSALRRSR